MADDDATRMSRAIAEARSALQPQNDRERNTNTAIGVVSGALTGNPLIAATQAVVANQQPTTLERIGASATDVNPNSVILPPTMEQIQREERSAAPDPIAELQRRYDQQRNERQRQTNPELLRLGIEFDGDVGSREVVSPPVPGGAAGGPRSR